MTTNSEDAALAYLLLSEIDPTHYYTELYGSPTEGPPEPHISAFSDISDLSDIRIGVFPEWFQDSAEPIQKQCKEVLDFLESRGAKIISISIPHLQTIRLAHGMYIIPYTMLFSH